MVAVSVGVSVLFVEDVILVCGSANYSRDDLVDVSGLVVIVAFIVMSVEEISEPC